MSTEKKLKNSTRGICKVLDILSKTCNDGKNLPDSIPLRDDVSRFTISENCSCV